MGTINERIQWIIDNHYHGNKKRFADDIGVSTSAIDGIVGGRKSFPSYQVLRKISSELEISADWLINGNGHPYKQTTNNGSNNSVSLKTNVGSITNHMGHTNNYSTSNNQQSYNDIIGVYIKMIEELTEQLKAKDEQLKAKDEQLTKIITLLNSK